MSSSSISAGLVIVFLNLFTPFCILTASIAFAARLMRHDMVPLQNEIYCLSETVFYLFYLFRRRRILLSDQNSPAPTPQNRARMWKDTMRALEGEGRAGLEVWLTGWFVRAHQRPLSLLGKLVESLRSSGLLPTGAEDIPIPMEEIKRGNVEEWLAATFFHLPLSAVLQAPLTHHAMTSLVLALECKRKCRFLSGHNDLIRPICPAMDAIQMAHRPLALYLVVTLVNSLVDGILYIAGFKAFHLQGELGYLYHPGLSCPGAGMISLLLGRNRQATGSRPEPIILLHGLGGYAPLIHLILSLLTLDRPIFIVIQPQISFQIALFPHQYSMVSSIHNMLVRHGHERDEGLIVAHSIGTSLASALHRSPGSKYSTILIDPISILPLYPHFSRRTVSACRRSSSALRYFTLEPGTTQYISRRLDAFEGGLDLSVGESNDRLRVVLARDDELNPVRAIIRHCVSNGVQVTVLENTNHAGFLSNLAVLSLIREPAKKITQQVDKETDKVKSASASMVQRPSSRGVLSSQITKTSGRTWSPRMGRIRSRTTCLAGMGMGMVPLVKNVMVPEGDLAGVDGSGRRLIVVA